jgi:hypothetical protein
MELHHLGYIHVSTTQGPECLVNRFGNCVTAPSLPETAAGFGVALRRRVDRFVHGFTTTWNKVMNLDCCDQV